MFNYLEAVDKAHYIYVLANNTNEGGPDWLKINKETALSWFKDIEKKNIPFELELDDNAYYLWIGGK